MKILFFTDHFKPEPSAPAAHVYERAKIWVRMGHNVTVICSAPNFPEGRIYQGYKNRWRTVESMDGIRVVRVKTFITSNAGFAMRILDYLSYMFSAFFFAIFEKKPGVVISTSPHLFVPVAGVMYSKLKRVPHVFELRDLWPASIQALTPIKPKIIYRILEKTELFLYARSARILSFTNAYANDLRSRGVPSEKVDVVICGGNLELYSPRQKDREIEKKYGLDKYFVVGYLGTIGMAHGLENILNTAAILKGRAIKFLLVGVGAAKKELETRAQGMALDNVVFVPRQLQEDMPRYWSVCDVSLIHLKNCDVFSKVVPSKIFIAMAMGLPIIYVGPRGEGVSIVEQHECGIWVSPDDPKMLAQEIMNLAEDTLQCKRYSANGTKASQLYSRERQADQTLAVLGKAIHSTGD